MKAPGFFPVSLLALFLLSVLSGCGDKEPPATADVTPPALPPAAAPAAPAPAPAAVATESRSWSPEALEELLAPVALYPEAVLGQVLATSTNPQEVLDAGNWLVANPQLQGKQLETASAALGFTVPMQSLLQFPEVVDMMCMNMDWTSELGEAFKADQPGVLAAVQRLRKQATEVGSLKSSEQMKVETVMQDEEEVITVQPTKPEVVYVPQYDPVAAYAPPAAGITSSSTTVVDDGNDYSSGEMITTGLLAFGAGILVNEVFSDDDDDDDDYYPRYGGYGGGGYYPQSYNPRYGSGFRPADNYRRPAQYERGFNNNNVIVTDGGKDYWDRQKNDRRQAKSPISSARASRPELTELNTRTRSATSSSARQKPEGDWKGQNSYAGAKPAERAKLDRQLPAKPDLAGQKTYAGVKPAVRDKSAIASAGARDRGYGSKAKAPSTLRQTAQSKAGGGGESAKKKSAFQGAKNSGSSERKASERGRSSLPKGVTRKSSGSAGTQRKRG